MYSQYCSVLSDTITVYATLYTKDKYFDPLSMPRTHLQLKLQSRPTSQKRYGSRDLITVSTCICTPCQLAKSASESFLHRATLQALADF